MEKEQLEKKVEWLDAERRELLKGFNKLEQQTSEMSQTILEQQGTIKELRSELTRLNTRLAKISEFEKQIKDHKGEIKKGFKGLEKQSQLLYKELEGKFQSAQTGVQKTLANYESEFGEIQLLRKNMKARELEDKRLADQVASISESIEGVIGGEQQRVKLARNLEEFSSRGEKRAAAMQGEVAAVLQRMDEAAAKVELVADVQKRVEQRLDETANQEEDRRQDQKEFLEKATDLQNERELAWKHWSKRFEAIEQQSLEIAARLKDIETTDLAVKRAQRAFDELVDKINRRVNELIEVQRLGEQRLRQEWSTHQVDAQKRWSNFVLSLEEQQREAERQRERLQDRVTELEDRLQDVHDTTQHLMEQIERFMQAVLEVSRDSLNENERYYKSPS